MTSIQHFDTDPMLEHISDLQMCNYINELDNIYKDYNNKIFSCSAVPNELLRKERSDLALLYFDNFAEMNKKKCDSRIVQEHLGNKTGNPGKLNTGFFIPTCGNATDVNRFINSQHCNKQMCCSLRHELFGNVTKAKQAFSQ